MQSQSQTGIINQTWRMASAGYEWVCYPAWTGHGNDGTCLSMLHTNGDSCVYHPHNERLVFFLLGSSSGLFAIYTVESVKFLVIVKACLWTVQTWKVSLLDPLLILCYLFFLPFIGNKQSLLEILVDTKIFCCSLSWLFDHLWPVINHSPANNDTFPVAFKPYYFLKTYCKVHKFTLCLSVYTSARKTVNTLQLPGSTHSTHPA